MARSIRAVIHDRSVEHQPVGAASDAYDHNVVPLVTRVHDTLAEQQPERFGDGPLRLRNEALIATAEARAGFRRA